MLTAFRNICNGKEDTELPSLFRAITSLDHYNFDGEEEYVITKKSHSDVGKIG